MNEDKWEDDDANTIDRFYQRNLHRSGCDDYVRIVLIAVSRVLQPLTGLLSKRPYMSSVGILDCSCRLPFEAFLL